MTMKSRLQRLERLVKKLKALERYNATILNNTTDGITHGTLALSPDGCYYCVDAVKRLIDEAEDC